MRPIPPSWEPHLRSILRIVVAFLFVAHGTQKLFGFPGSRTPVAVMSLLGVASLLETFGGTLVFLGLFTRLITFLLAGEMAVAYFIGHAPNGFWPLVNRGEPAVLFCFVFLYLAAAGPGPWSLDALRGPRARST